MNNIIELRGSFNSAPFHRRPVSVQLPKEKSVTVAMINHLITSLYAVDNFWKRANYPFKPLISLHYRDIIAKSNRMKFLLREPGRMTNEMIVGSKFSSDEPVRHIMTYRLERGTIQKGLERLKLIRSILTDVFGGEITSEELQDLNSQKKLEDGKELWRKRIIAQLKTYNLKRSPFSQGIKDCWYIEFFSVEEAKAKAKGNQIVTFYDLGIDITQLSKFLGFHLSQADSLDGLTYRVTPEQYQLIMRQAPYVVAMSVEDLGKLDPYPFFKNTHSINSTIAIPEPTNEPIVGVIDTLFDTSVYFSSWVEYHQEVTSELIEIDDYNHGTAISSIIVDGPTLNPLLEDGCGRFRVRHFGVAKHSRNSSFLIMKKIRQIVEANPDIKVWNLSLGSPYPIEQDAISAEGAFLDELQYEKDIIFVVAGTNTENSNQYQSPIGSPADSINSLVVNAATLLGEPTTYARKGPVLHFFNKPDVSTFGGDSIDQVVTFSNHGITKKSGTSVAAPWITRKVAYLVYKLGLSRELAKALVIDAAACWNLNVKHMPLLGYGVVPRHISEILTTPKDEIMFLVQGVVTEYETYSYSIPVPRTHEGYPYLAKVTCCYFPKCTRTQGVDYTNTEMDVKFGRLEDVSNKRSTRVTLRSIDNNRQGDPMPLPLFEKEVRATYRKWDTVKHFGEKISPRNRVRKQLNPGNPNWGISITTKERLEDRSGRNMRFGIVITLKAIDGVNRHNHFMQHCRANGWFIHEIDIDVMNRIYEQAEQTIEFTT